MQKQTPFRRHRIRLDLLALCLFAASSLFAQGSGALKGRVLDYESGDPLIGANVLIEKSSLGAATDSRGEYLINKIPAGAKTARISYLGYTTVTLPVTIVADSTSVQNFRLKPEALEGQEVVVTAQAFGQNAAINQQLTSRNVVNVVSAARIQQLPDDNAAESIGRLPGVSLVRSNGQATQVVIRGLQPQYNSVTIEGVPIPANDAGQVTEIGSYTGPKGSPGGRAVDMSLVSSNALEGIEVYKTVTPDMDAAVLGGTVNFNLKEARGTPDGGPAISLLAQGGYNNLMTTYNDYKFVASVEQRFLDDRFGVFLQGVAQKQNLTSNAFGGSYYIPNKQLRPDSVVLGSLSLTFSPVQQRRYNGTLSMDYKWSDGKIALVNMYSHGSMNNESHYETYNLANYGNNIYMGTSLSTNELNIVSSIFHLEQAIGSFKLNVRLSNAYSDSRTPGGWNVQFSQINAGTGNIPTNWDPGEIARKAESLINLDNLKWENNSTWANFNKDNDVQGSIDLETNFNLGDVAAVALKGGGSYRYTSRYYNYDVGYGSLYSGAAQGFRYTLVNQNLWLAQPPYNFDPTGAQYFPINGVYDPSMDFGKFLRGEYTMHSAVDAGLLDPVMSLLKTQGDRATQSQTVPSYLPDQFGSTANDYTGYEKRSAGYVMAKIDIGPQLNIIPGVRYQGLKTSYTAAQFLGNADLPNPYPSPLMHTMVTAEQYHGYWLPDVSVRYLPFLWLSIRGSYTTTLAYPDYYAIIPKMDVSSNSGHYVIWNNYALKPARSENYDMQVAVYDNSVGLFAVTPFLKHIEDQLFSQSTFISDPSKYPGVPSYTKTFSLFTYVNNPNKVDVWGIETEWQTHFWYLPAPFDGLVLNVNYTHIFSEATYPYTVTTKSPVYPYSPINVDTTYTDRLIQQPKDIVNLSIGYDYRAFSILASMIYQSEVYNGTAFYNSLRSDKSKYLRWDLSVKQGLPVNGLELFFNLYDLNSESDIYAVRGSGFPTSESNYGLSANLGVRWTMQ
jgi:TonB-dependent receptor